MALVEKRVITSSKAAPEIDIKNKQVLDLTEYRRWVRESQKEKDPVLLLMLTRPLANILYHLGLR